MAQVHQIRKHQHPSFCPHWSKGTGWWVSTRPPVSVACTLWAPTECLSMVESLSLNPEMEILWLWLMLW